MKLYKLAQHHKKGEDNILELEHQTTCNEQSLAVCVEEGIRRLNWWRERNLRSHRQAKYGLNPQDAQDPCPSFPTLGPADTTVWNFSNFPSSPQSSTTTPVQDIFTLCLARWIRFPPSYPTSNPATPHYSQSTPFTIEFCGLGVWVWQNI